LQWRDSHAQHHATAQQIENRGISYFWTMTVGEYQGASKGKRLAYRLYHHPLILFALGGCYTFLINFRLPYADSPPRAKRQVHMHNLVYILLFGGLGLWLGFGTVLLVQLPIAFISTTAGLWLFHVQHHYEETYWAPKAQWSYERAALEGSSYLKLDPITQYFAGNINFHHIHHLVPRIPNYRLPDAQAKVALFRAVEPLTVRQALASYRCTLVDETTERWVGFDAVRPSEANRWTPRTG